MAFLICDGFPMPFSAMSSAASPATCGVAWLVPINPDRRLPAAHGNEAVPSGPTTMAVLEQNDHTHDATSTPHGHLLNAKLCAASAFPPGPATLIADRPKFV